MFLVPIPTIALFGEGDQRPRQSHEFLAAIVKRRISTLTATFGLDFAEDLERRFAFEHPLNRGFQIPCPSDDIQALAQITFIMGITPAKWRKRSCQQLARSAIFRLRTFGAKQFKPSGSIPKPLQPLQSLAQQSILFAKRARNQTNPTLLLNLANCRFEFARFDVLFQK